MSLGTPLATPTAAAAPAPAADPALEAATKRYQEGITERDAGDFVTAAESFTAAFKDIPAKSREILSLIHI